MYRKTFIVFYLVILGIYVYAYDGVTRATDVRSKPPIDELHVDLVQEVEANDETELSSIGEEILEELREEKATESEAKSGKESVVGIPLQEEEATESEAKSEKESVVGISPQEEESKKPKKIGSIILFYSGGDERIAPALRFSEEETVLVSDYEAVDFLPDTTSDFVYAKPTMVFNKDGVVQRGALVIRRELGEYWYERIEEMVGVGLYEDALIFLEKLVHYNYEVDACYYSMGFIYYKSRKYSDGLVTLAMVEESKNEELVRMSHELTGEMLYILKKFIDAEEAYLKAISPSRSTTKDASLIYKAGLSAYRTKDYEKTRKLWNEAAELGNKNAELNLKWLNR